MNTPIDIGNNPIPAGWFLILGGNLPNIARPAKVGYRVAQRRSAPGQGSHWKNVGIIIKQEDIPTWEKAILKARARKEHNLKLKAK